jgi:hypothetical protein
MLGFLEYRYEQETSGKPTGYRKRARTQSPSIPERVSSFWQLEKPRVPFSVFLEYRGDAKRVIVKEITKDLTVAINHRDGGMVRQRKPWFTQSAGIEPSGEWLRIMGRQTPHGS